MIVYMYIILICKSDNYIVGMIYVVFFGIFYIFWYFCYDFIEVNLIIGKVIWLIRIFDWGKWCYIFYKFIYIVCLGINIFF